MSTHNLCFGAKIGIPLHTPDLLYKSGVGVGGGGQIHGHVFLMKHSMKSQLFW